VVVGTTPRTGWYRYCNSDQKSGISNNDDEEEEEEEGEEKEESCCILFIDNLSHKINYCNNDNDDVMG